MQSVERVGQAVAVAQVIVRLFLMLVGQVQQIKAEPVALVTLVAVEPVAVAVALAW